MNSRASRRTAALAALATLTLGVGSGLIGWWAASRPPDLPTVAAPPGGYPVLLKEAADNLRAQVALDGTGMSFEITQRQFLHHADGAPPILVEPAPSASPVEVQDLFQAGYLTHGFIHGQGYFAETRGGLPATGPGDFAASELVYKVLIDDGVVWRDHGKGWFEVPAAAIPGNGIDPFSLSRLPALLSSLVEIKDAGVDQVDNRATHHFVGLGESANWPGIIVPDGLLFTASPVGIEAWVSDDGHLVQLRGQTANLNEATQTSVIVTEVHLGGDVPALPAPSPLFVRPTPEPDGSAVPPSASPAP